MNETSRHTSMPRRRMRTKYWLKPDTFDIQVAHEYNLHPADRRQIRQVIFEHFDYIYSEYERFHREVE